jgi:restriction endonuclease Mrr
MSHEHDLHIMPLAVGWKIVATTQAQPLAVTSTREEAVALAKRMEFEDLEYGEVLVHGRDGEIRERITIDRGDLFPLRG